MNLRDRVAALEGKFLPSLDPLQYICIRVFDGRRGGGLRSDDAVVAANLDGIAMPRMENETIHALCLRASAALPRHRMGSTPVIGLSYRS